MNILHIAPFNTAGVPIALVKAERELSHNSRLITLGRDRRNYEEDLCLDLPLLDFWLTRLAKRLFSNPDKLRVTNRLPQPASIPIEWHPNNRAEDLLVRLRERLWQRRIERAMAEVCFWDFDVYQLDGGLEFYRDGRTVRRLKSMGKRIICCYTGSDLRTRGVIPAIDCLCDARVTVEFDHLRLHPEIEHVFFPFDVRKFELQPPAGDGTVRIGHAPTNRAAKGSDTIIHVIRELAQTHPVELVLIEGLPWSDAMRLKQSCDIFVDQIGELGYGINSLEALAMGIPTCSCLAPGFAERYPDHPFVVVNGENLREELLRLVEDPELRRSKGVAGRDWVERYHDPRRVVHRIHTLAGLADESKDFSDAVATAEGSSSRGGGVPI
jgi:glycosyltransferase involved in cell wall biosynthesis